MIILYTKYISIPFLLILDQLFWQQFNSYATHLESLYLTAGYYLDLLLLSLHTYT